MDPLENLHNEINNQSRALWQLRPWEISQEQRGERELAIRDKTQELADRNNEVEGAIAAICEVTGVVKAPGADKHEQYPAAEIALPNDPVTGKRLISHISRSPSGSAFVRYYSIDSRGESEEIPRSQKYHTNYFDVEDTSALSLELKWGTFTWSNDRTDYDDSRVEILEVAESVIGAWEGITSMLLEAVRNPELNPEFATRMNLKDALALMQRERVAAFFSGAKEE
jgi:hypothetical protein